MRSTGASAFIISSLVFFNLPGLRSSVYGQFLPYYREATCGANCLYAVCRLKSIDTTLGEVYRLVNITEKGSSMLDLVEAAKKLGLHPKPLKTTVKKLREKDAYAIVHLKRKHFVLCVGWRGDEMVVVDPPKAAYLMNRKDFQEQWTGYALLFDRTTKPDKNSPDRKPATKEGATRSLNAASISENGKNTPEMARMLLSAIKKQKSSRDDIRGLHEMLNKPAPKIQASSWLNCSPMTMEEFRGRIIVLEFWEFTCNACIGEIENLHRIHESSKNIPVTVISIHSYGEDISPVKRFINKRNIKYPVCVSKKGIVNSDGKAFEQYATHAVPRRFFIDIHGRIRSIDTVVGPTLKELLEESSDGKQHVTSYDLNKRYGVKVAPKRVVFGKLRVGQKMQKSVYIYKPDDPA